MKSKKNLIFSISVFIVFIIVLFAFANKILSYLKLSSSLHNLVLAIVVLIAGTFIINFIENKFIKNIYKVVRMKRRREQNLINFLFLTFAYFILLLVVLKVLNIDITNILLGGAFIGVIAGLASQNLLTNLFAGAVILIFNQFEIGERVKISTWQYDFLLPSYANKFFSSDILTPGYSGVIYNVGIFYTDIKLDEGYPIKIPNSILIQAAVQKLDKVKSFRSQIKYELDKKFKFEDVQNKVNDIIEKSPFEKDSVEIYIDETSLNTYILKIILFTKERNIDLVKSYILEHLIETFK